MKRRKLNKKGKRTIALSSIFGFAIIIIVIFGLINNDKDNKLSNSKEIKKEEKNINKEEKIEEKKIKIIDLDSDSRPYAVMINNISNVWGYQSGIQDAYLVYEIIVEGGYTRLMAVYKDVNLDRIGSVRSSRHYFLDYALENDAVYVHFGWSPQAESDIKSLGVNNINFLSYNGYTRDKSLNLASEHTAFTTTEDIKNGEDYYNYRTTSNQKSLLNYSADEIDLLSYNENQVANKIYIEYSKNRSTSYEYDSENKVYKRFQNNQEHIDYDTKNQYTAKNIIIYQVSNSTISGDDKGRQDIDNIGSGEGYYITNGYAIPITWNKSSRARQTVYKTLDGEELIVNDGNTFIQIQPKGFTLTIE